MVHGADPDSMGVMRNINADEIAVLTAATKRAAVVSVTADMRASIPNLVVVWACSCGCASVNFEVEEGMKVTPVAWGVGHTPRGGQVGVIVWGMESRLTGLEIYDLGAEDDDLVLPVPALVIPWKAATQR